MIEKKFLTFLLVIAILVIGALILKFVSDTEEKTEEIAYPYVVIVDKKIVEPFSSTPKIFYMLEVTDEIDTFWVYTSKERYDKVIKNDKIYNCAIVFSK